MTRASVASPNSAQASAAAFMVGQSESLPIKIPTWGLPFFFIRSGSTMWRRSGGGGRGLGGFRQLPSGFAPLDVRLASLAFLDFIALFAHIALYFTGQFRFSGAL